jgi:hypothetical protein
MVNLFKQKRKTAAEPDKHQRDLSLNILNETIKRSANASPENSEIAPKVNYSNFKLKDATKAKFKWTSQKPNVNV